jgi:hypothetical protein
VRLGMNPPDFEKALPIKLVVIANEVPLSLHQASLIVDTALDSNNALDMHAKEPFQFRERSGEKSLVLLC